MFIEIDSSGAAADYDTSKSASNNTYLTLRAKVYTMTDPLPKSIAGREYVTLRRTDGNRYCTHQGHGELPEGALVVEIDDPCVTSVHIGVRDIDAVSNILHQHPESRRELETVKMEKRTASPTERQCSICRDSFEDGAEPYYLRQGKRTNTGGVGAMRADTYIHDEGCATELQELLDRAWNHSDILLPEVL